MNALAFQREYTLGMARLFEDLPALLSHLRKQSGETLAEIEAATGISLGSVQAYEKGATAPPLPKLEILMEHFGVADLVSMQAIISPRRCSLVGISSSRRSVPGCRSWTTSRIGRRRGRGQT